MIVQSFEENKADLDNFIANKNDNVDKIIEKWRKLQNIIKEELTLEELISKIQKKGFEQLKKCFKEYYKNKLEARKILEEIKCIENNGENNIKKLNIEKELEHIFLDISEPIKNLLFLFRNNYDYIITLVSLINEYDDEDKVKSLVELFCNQFYENILTKNAGTEELIILIYKLLENEINPMNFASIDEFLSDDTFLGKFISSFLKRYELKQFLTLLINPFILNIDNSKGDDYCGMSLIKIKDYINEKINNGYLEKENAPNDFNIHRALFENITKSSIVFNKENEEFDKDDDINNDEEIWQNMTENWIKKFEDDSYNKNYNNDYKINLDLDFLNDKINKENNLELKNFYIYELEQITYDPDIYSNKTIIELFKENIFKENLKSIVSEYKRNFNFLKSTIDYFIQLLINQVEMIPYSLRCICKVISILLKQKFPLYSNYVRNSFIGKFIFDKCIFPVLCLENKNSLEPRIISKSTKKCLIDIVSILNHANKCQLFNCELDSEKTIFNHYLIEIIPILNKFYEKLIDVDLPNVFDNLLLKTKQNLDQYNRKMNFHSKELNKKQEEIDNNKNKQLIKEKNRLIYNYFNIHEEEILNLQCICFSLDDILFILSLIGRNIRAFKNLPDFIFFERTYEFIQPSDYKLDQENSKNPDCKNFFVIFRDEKNPDLKNYLKEKIRAIAFCKDEEDSLSICKKLKFCLKKVLIGLNDLNKKDYEYLNTCINSRQFFNSLKMILEEKGEFPTIKNRIPLEWYAQYISNNIDNLDEKYKYDDYLEIYNEIFKEETEILSKLKIFISIMLTKKRLNLGNAEYNLATTKKELIHIKKMEDYVKVEKFINEEEIEVCIQTNELKNDNIRTSGKKRSFTMAMFFKKDKDLEMNEIKKNKISLLITDNLNCPHNQKINEISENENSQTKIPYHAYNIKDFISKFSEDPWKEENSKKYEKPKNLVLNDIISGNKNNQIYKALNVYMEIVKKHLVNPTNGQQIFTEWQNENQFNILEKIKDYIIRQIYKYIYPKDELREDLNFYNKVKKLKWIKPEHLNIKNINIHHLNNAISLVKRFELYKSIKDKLRCINKIYIDIDNAIKFEQGINNEIKYDEIKTLFVYIIIKAQPKRMLTNINYIKCFTDYIEIDEKISQLLTLLESSKEFIINISYQFLNITRDEFDKNMNKIIN